jgi:hypothetical protein
MATAALHAAVRSRTPTSSSPAGSASALRRVFYMVALSSIRTDGPSKAFYQRKRDEYKIHTQALLALARRLVNVLGALLRDNRAKPKAI